MEKGQLCEEPLPARARSDSDTFSIERWGDDDGTGRSSATTLQIGGGASCCSSPLAAFSGSEQCEEPSPVDAEATAAERQASAAEEKAACGANMPVPSCRTPCARSRSCSSSSGSVARSSPSPGAARLPPVGLFSTPVNRPQCPAGCEHWQGPLWDATSTHRAKLPRKPSRRVLQVLLCAGMGAELLANWSMALDEIDVVSVHEVKRYAQRWLQRLWGSKVQHIFVENYALVAGSGWCVKHGKRCAVPLGRRLDIASGGFPCKPFSLQRQRTGSTASTGPNEKHPQYATVMDEMDDILQAARPLTFWMEEVEQFTSKRAALGGLSPLDVCAKKWRTHGYALRAVILDHFLFVEVPKNVALSLVSTRMVALRKLLTGQWTSSSLLHGTGCSHRQHRSWISSTPEDLKRHGAGLHARTVSPGSIAVYIRLLASIGSQISKSYVWFVSMFF